KYAPKSRKPRPDGRGFIPLFGSDLGPHLAEERRQVDRRLQRARRTKAVAAADPLLRQVDVVFPDDLLAQRRLDQAEAEPAAQFVADATATGDLLFFPAEERGQPDGHRSTPPILVAA